MAALLVALSVMAIMMTVVMPVWKQTAQREKEEELIFRGLQYTHALTLFSRKYANAAPPNLDVLVEQRFLRRKYKDPITQGDFQLILAGQGAPGSAQQPGRGGQQQPGAGGRATPPAQGASPVAGGGRGTTQIGTQGAGGVGGIVGVTSKSKDKSIRLYNGRSRYNEWTFMAAQQQQAPGGAPGGVPGQPGQPGGRGQQPGQNTNPFGTTAPGGQRGRQTGPGGQQPGPGRFNQPGPPPPTPRGRL
jgi:type II secretory pathway pseudopilin PulG